MLPRSDLVMLVDTQKPKAEPKIIGWAVFERELAHLVQELDYHPPRYRVTEYPSDELIARLPAVAL